MKCPKCGIEVKVYSSGEGTNSYEPVNEKLVAAKAAIPLPFYCDMCGAIRFPFQAVRDVVFLYPRPLPEKVGLIYLPKEEFVGGSTQEKFKAPDAIVLSVGEGSIDKDRKRFISTKGVLETGDHVFYNRRIPWRMKARGMDGEDHMVVFCGVLDVWGLLDGTS
jgi:hypothetical protein